MIPARLNESELNSARLNGGEYLPYSISSEMRRLNGSQPITKVEFVHVDGTVVDVTDHYLFGATFEQVKERAPDEISAGDFDIVMANHDDMWSEYIIGTMLNGLQYHGAKIKIYQGFVMPDGTEEYEIQAVGLVDELKTDRANSTVTLRCRDRVRRILDETLNPKSYELIPQADISNTGNGLCSAVETKPFKTVNETWTLTCDIAGADGVGRFTIVGSVTGSKGTVLSGTEYSSGTGTGGIKFTITAGSVNWAVGDEFVFETNQHPQWSAVNAGKIIWSVLTGYNWDSNTAETWASRVLDFDHTQSSSNVDLDYDSFEEGIDDLDSFTHYNLTGFIAYDEDAVSFLQGLLLLFLGSLYTGADGRVKFKVYVPGAQPTPLADFSDERKITKLGYSRTQDEVINYISVQYKARNLWEFTGQTINYDGAYVAQDEDSRDKYKTLQKNFAVRWFAANGNHVIDFADKLIGKYREPPLNIDFETGLDALLTEIGDPVTVTDNKYGLFEVRGEVTRVTKNLDNDPVLIGIRVRRESDLDRIWGYIGSEDDEGDGISPQPDDWDLATDEQKFFAYFSESGDTTVDYRMF